LSGALRRGLRVVSVATTLGAAACTKGLVPGNAYDRPLMTFSGTVKPAGGLAQAVNPIVGLLWTDPLQHKPDVPMPALWMHSSVDKLADTFTVDVFRPPPPEAVIDLGAPPDGGEVAQLALAEIVIIDDQNGDGTFRIATPPDAGAAPPARDPRATIAPPEMYLAGSPDVVTYVVRPLPSAHYNPLTLPGRSGYALVSYNCAGQISQSTVEVSKSLVDMILQPSASFPDVRPCRASHGP
jgi:hypothetical protein